MSRWRMLLSHHAPQDLDRTIRVAGVHLCSRCVGVSAGTAALVALHMPATPWPLAAEVALGAVPILDFALHESGLSPSSTFRRLASGVLIGPLACDFVRSSTRLDWLRALACLGAYLGLQFACAWFLARHGRLEALVARYEAAICGPCASESSREDRFRSSVSSALRCRGSQDGPQGCPVRSLGPASGFPDQLEPHARRQMSVGASR